MKRVAREVWTKRVEQWTASGKTAEAFASELGLNARSLKWWKWQLGASMAVKRASRKTAAITKTPVVSPMTFVEMTAAVVSDAIEVVLPSSVRVAVRPGFDERTLDRVLDVLEARR
jgi:hypothetical protein